MLDAGGAQETAVADAQTNIDGNAWGKAGARISQHVAIDRWTGGAADGFLFNRLQPPKSTGTFRLALDLARLVDCDGKDVSGACIALLLFVLRDLAQGRIAVGFGGNRGLGSIEIVDFKIESAGKAAAMRGFSAAEFKPEALTNPDSAFLQGFGAANAAWKSYWQGRKQEGEGKGGGNV